MRSFFQARADELEWMLNWVSDQDTQWWPFLFLRPEAHELMSTPRVAALAALLGVFCGMLANFALIWSGRAAELHVATLPLCASVGFFLFYRATFAYSWNRRARRLAPPRPDRSRKSKTTLET
jgi:hypothetical protein